MLKVFGLPLLATSIDLTGAALRRSDSMLKRYHRHFVYSFILSFVLAGCSSKDALLSGELPPPKINKPEIAPTITSPVVDSRLIVPGDTLELFVKEDPSLNGSYLVREGGYILIPRVGRISVAGMRTSDAESRVKSTLQTSQLAQASVLIEKNEARSQETVVGGQRLPPNTAKIMIYVTGAVSRSGPHTIPLPAGRSLGAYEALLISGGMSRLAQDQRVEILRVDSTGRRHRAIVDLNRVKQGLAEDPPVGEGDIIHVPEKVFGF